MEIMNFHDVDKNEVKDCGNEQLKKKTEAGIEVKKLTAQLLDKLKTKWRRINWIRNITRLWVLMKLQTYDTIMETDNAKQNILKRPHNCTPLTR